MNLSQTTAGYLNTGIDYVNSMTKYDKLLSQIKIKLHCFIYCDLQQIWQQFYSNEMNFFRSYFVGATTKTSSKEKITICRSALREFAHRRLEIKLIVITLHIQPQIHEISSGFICSNRKRSLT